jgi:hypothetical protein
MDEFASQSQNCSKFVCNKSLRGIRFNKGYRDIAGDIASHHFIKASIPLKMYLKSFEILEKVFNKHRNFYKSLTLSLKISLKSLKIVQNASHY